MTFYSLEERPREELLDGAPKYVRVALLRLQRASSAIRVYKRRGWNPSAAEFALSRARTAFDEALDRWEFESTNPGLF